MRVHDLAAIQQAVLEVEKAKRVLQMRVQEARQQGETWTEIAPWLGTTRQAAQQRFGKGEQRVISYPET